MTSTNELKQYIDQVHQEPFHLLFNNCFHKSWRIFKRAKKLRIKVRLLICVSKNPKWWWVFTIILPHFYVTLKTGKVDVALSPEQEEEYWRNDDIKIFLPIEIGKT